MTRMAELMLCLGNGLDTRGELVENLPSVALHQTIRHVAIIILPLLSNSLTTKHRKICKNGLLYGDTEQEISS